MNDCKNIEQLVSLVLVEDKIMNAPWGLNVHCLNADM